MENDYQVAWVQNTSDSAVVTAGRATHNAMRWRPTRGIGNFVFSGIMAGGRNMIQDGYASFIGGGDWNCIYPSPGSSYTLYRSFIGGGFENCIESNNSVVAGGITNSILTSNADAAVIAGGANNTVSGPCSAILGGHNNNDGGLSNVHIVGSGITALSPNTIHVNGLWANGLPTYAGGPPIAPAGTVFILAPGTPAPAWAQGQLWIA